MDVNKFASQASQKISDKNKRKEFERELRCHIEDLTEHFEDMGYPKEEATQKALETMGNGEKVGEEMGKVHNLGEFIMKIMKKVLCGSAILLIIVVIATIAFHHAHVNQHRHVDFYTGTTDNQSAEEMTKKLSAVTKSQSGDTIECEFEKYGVKFEAVYELGEYVTANEITYKLVGDYTDEEIEAVYKKIYNAYKFSAVKFDLIAGIGYYFEEETDTEKIFIYGAGSQTWNVAFSKDLSNSQIHCYLGER